MILMMMMMMMMINTDVDQCIMITNDESWWFMLNHYDLSWLIIIKYLNYDMTINDDWWWLVTTNDDQWCLNDD